MRGRWWLLVLLLTPLQLQAQQDDEYLMEIGGGIGLTAYVGDFNNHVLKQMQPSVSLLLRRNLNPYSGFRLSLAYGKLKGSTEGTATWFPATTVAQGVTPLTEADVPTTPAAMRYAFSNSMADATLVYEYNFWPYGTGRDYRGARRLTPFLFGGLGATYITAGTDKVCAMQVPVGVGVKYKVATRLNVALEWCMHFSLSDRLDGVEDPYGIPSSGMFKNADGYSALQLSLSYSFMTKCRTCNNDD